MSDPCWQRLFGSFELTAETPLAPFASPHRWRWDLQSDLCQSCKAITEDVLSGWETEQATRSRVELSELFEAFGLDPPDSSRGSFGTGFAFVCHKLASVTSFMESLNRSCYLCKLIAHTLRHTSEGDRYTIYIVPERVGIIFIATHTGVSETETVTITAIGFFVQGLPASSDSVQTGSLPSDVRFVWSTRLDGHRGIDSLNVDLMKKMKVVPHGQSYLDTHIQLARKWLHNCVIGHPCLEICSSNSLRGKVHVSEEELERYEKQKDPSTYHEAAIEFDRQWTERCATSHSCLDICSASPLPNRVLDIGQPAGKVRLYISDNEPAPYATLSYRWGSALPLKTLTTNFDQHRAEVPWSTIPETLKDAIRIAQAMGFRYIWIDALCIIQDDSLDWAKEAVQMTDIYQRSALNISVVDSGSCDDGVLRSLSKDGCIVASTGSARLVATNLATWSSTEGYQLQNQLSTRGWTFQETLVSPTSLHCTIHGLQWECREREYRSNGHLLERYGRIHPVKSHTLKESWMKLSKNLSAPQSSHRSGSHTREQALVHRWHDLIALYSGRQLTISDDKLPAVGGLALQISRVLGWKYAAGLWEDHLLTGLTWYKAVDESPLVRRHGRAPSWSWASVDGKINYQRVFSANNNRAQASRMYPTPDFEIQKTLVTERFPGTFGAVLSASIEAHGHLHEVTIGGGCVSGHLSFIPAEHLWICLDEESGPVVNRKDPLWCVRIIYHQELRLSGGAPGLRNYFLLLERTGMREGEFRRVGLMECSFAGYKFNTWEEIEALHRFQEQLDLAVLEGERQSFTIV